jgi:hypothetical protein
VAKFPKRIGRIIESSMDEKGLNFTIKLNKKWIKKVKRDMRRGGKKG